MWVAVGESLLERTARSDQEERETVSLEEFHSKNAKIH